MVYHHIQTQGSILEIIANTEIFMAGLKDLEKQCDSISYTAGRRDDDEIALE